jgi:hypothetical protein
MTPQHKPTPFVAYTIRKNKQGRYCVAGWHNRAIALWSCEPETRHLWNGNVRFGEPVAETNEIEGARATLPGGLDRVGYAPQAVELYLTP